MIGCKIVEVTVDTTLVGRSNVSVTVSTVVVVIVCVSKSVLVVGGEPNTDVFVLVTVNVLNRVTWFARNYQSVINKIFRKIMNKRAKVSCIDVDVRTSFGFVRRAVLDSFLATVLAIVFAIFFVFCMAESLVL